MKLGFLFEYGTMNGGENSLFAVLAELRHSITPPAILAPPSDSFIQICSEFNFQLIPFDLNEFGKEAIRLTDALTRIINEANIDLLHANSLTAGRKLGLVATQLPVPTTSHLRDIMKLSGPAYEALSAHRGLIAVSQATRDFHCRQGLPSEKVSVIHNGVDLAHFRPRSPTGWLHRKLGLPPDIPLAGVVGQICLRKGHHDIAHAAVLLKDRLPDLHYVVVGQRHSTKAESVEFDEELTRIFDRNGIANRLVRIGWQTRMEEIYPEFRLLIHAARQEPLGRVLLEAAASGVPVVATNVGGTQEIFDDQRSACLVPSADPARLAQGIEKLMTNPNICHEFSVAARHTMEERFPVQRAAQRHLEFWSMVLVEQNSSSGTE